MHFFFILSHTEAHSQPTPGDLKETMVFFSVAERVSAKNFGYLL